MPKLIAPQIRIDKMNYNRKITKKRTLGRNVDKGHPEVVDGSRPISIIAWVVLGLIALATFVSFMTLDPNPSLLLSFCATVNVAIMLAAMYRLYQWDLLLSPIMIIFIGPTMIMYYSWGNLGVRIAGESGYARNFGTLQYYPQVALLSTMGLLLYCVIVFGVFQKAFRHVTLKYQDLYWQPWQAIATILLSLTMLAYLSFKYSFTGGYFRGAESDFDRWFIATINSFVILAVIVSVSVLAKASTNIARLLALFGVILSVVLALGLRSRTFMLMVLILIALCWLTLKPKQARLSFFLPISLVGIMVFSLGTVVKSSQSETSSIFDNLSAVSSQGSAQIIALTSQGVGIDSQYRLGGFELPAAILRCLDLGAPSAHGDGLIGAALQGLPGFLRPPGVFAERGNIALHYWRYCLFYDDSMAIPLVSGLGDWGIIGVFIYVLFGVFSLILWRVAQKSPRLFLAYLLVPFFPDTLFWSGVFTYIKTMSFLWLILWIIGSLLMPRWLPSNHEQSELD
jgi:hypothetical protein